MRIWVDADACPKAIKAILIRAAERAEVVLTFVANQPVPIPRSRYIKSIRVAPGFDGADCEIVKHVADDDLVVTADIPLAAEAIAKGGYALSPRGELYTSDNIKARLTMRDFMDTLRASGINTGGPAPLSQKDRQAFAGQLDKLLARQAKQR
ncbi:YaiI/YqxD family protein [Nitrococcus mobilis]|uniref:UPF0178 protein NB231_14763 n=1 Tax=Nitrococcus mobilis Nb-231 TaxID=314278 RepID=A4BLA3_9GAMM|nr:YaiI/YqxD family protein [Nitrococcus mobilis]EAR23091.1 hypothetical protein NB231_14763 [Nitrococcus mobilis Nb-231]